MSKVSINESTLTSIGNAIRAKTGKSELIAPLNMATEINAIETGGGDLPEEAFNITGSGESLFANSNWNWFIENYGNKITTQNLSSALEMFYYNGTLQSIPFDINFQPSASSSQSMAKMFYNCKKLKNITGAIKNAYPSALTELFSGCNMLRELPVFENINFSYLHAASGGYMSRLFENCYSLRDIPSSLLKELHSKAGASYCLYRNGFSNCYTLENIVGLSHGLDMTITSNVFSSTFSNCARLTRVVFDTQEDGTPYVVNWKGQTIDLTAIGYMTSTSLGYITAYNSGITIDKEVANDDSYQALKDDPDWFSCLLTYSRYNHNSAVETINSLPDTSAYLAANGGTNTIKFKKGAGSKTDGGSASALTEEEIAVAAAKGWTVTLV